jgi:DMSO reductase anchor subunit
MPLRSFCPNTLESWIMESIKAAGHLCVDHLVKTTRLLTLAAGLQSSTTAPHELVEAVAVAARWRLVFFAIAAFLLLSSAVPGPLAAGVEVCGSALDGSGPLGFNASLGGPLSQPQCPTTA